MVCRKNGEWIGPLSLIELAGLDWLTPFTWITMENERQAKPAYEYKEINTLLKKGLPLPCGSYLSCLWTGTGKDLLRGRTHLEVHQLQR